MAVESQVAGGRTFFARLHWSAVIAGVALAIAAHIVMGLIGATLGFAAEPADSRGVGAAAAIWALITPFVATLLGAWLACRLAGEEDKRAANVHGILVWCIGLIAGALFLTGTMATGAMTAGTAASGNLGAAERAMRDTGTAAERAMRDTGTAARPGSPADVRQDEAAKRAAAGTGGAALGAIAGLLGAIVGAGLASRRREGRGLGWRIALERRGEAHAPRHERYAGTAPTYDERAPRVPATAAGTPPEVGGEPRDPYHH